MSFLTPDEYSDLNRVFNRHSRAVRQAMERMRAPGGPDAVERREIAERALLAVQHANEIMYAKGFPDNWAQWDRLADDARMLAAHSW